ncbi:MAG: adenylate kinase [Saccharofermentanales bacterium]|jgi:adenylate kinase
MMNIVLLGPPGSGKGTLAADLIRLYNFEYVSTGDIFRHNIREKTPLGLNASEYIHAGQLVPDHVTIAMIADHLKPPRTGFGILFDGFPRTVVQAEALDRMLGQMQTALHMVINLVVSRETVVERLSNRRLCVSCGRGYNLVSLPSKVPGVCDQCGGVLIQRADDRPETVRTRLEHYRDLTKPLAAYYQEKKILVSIDNEGSIEAYTQRAANAIAKVQQMEKCRL